MKRLLLIVATLLLASCNTERQEEAAEEEYAPIGPGSDSSALIPPDTPESRQGEASRQAPSQRDSL